MEAKQLTVKEEQPQTWQMRGVSGQDEWRQQALSNRWMRQCWVRDAESQSRCRAEALKRLWYPAASRLPGSCKAWRSFSQAPGRESGAMSVTERTETPEERQQHWIEPEYHTGAGLNFAEQDTYTPGLRPGARSGEEAEQKPQIMAETQHGNLPARARRGPAVEEDFG